MQESLTRREKERALHRQHIMEVALGLFSEHGYHEVSMQQIAAASEFSVGTLYNYFENKDALFDVILDTSCEQVLSILIPVLEGPENEQERLTQYIRTLPCILDQHSDVIRLYMALYGQKSGSRNIHELKLRESLLASLTQVIVSGIEHGVFHPVPPYFTALSIFVTLEAVTFDLVNGVCDDTPQAAVQKLEQLFLHTLLIK
ncbi:MAG: TetR/AcrR family transcriptional regulator [Phycisphaerae bacterium]|nr:TetR/AcrR family transcriptional regulator [Phycisphaerae bacterium]